MSRISWARVRGPEALTRAALELLVPLIGADVEAGDQQIAGGVDQHGRGDLLDAPERGGFLHPGKGLIVHVPIVDHRLDEKHALRAAPATTRFLVRGSAAIRAKCSKSMSSEGGF
jgi:hypothetical protein